MTVNTASAYVSEIFTSIEGEGLWAGTPAVFLRLSGCNLACSYCDTGYARANSETAVIYPERIAGDGVRVPNPMSADQVVDAVGGRSAGALVLTGGEPLLQAGFIRAVGRELRRMGYRLHLETNGTLFDALGGVKDVVDFISMDLKLPSSQGGKSLAAEHQTFLEALEGKPAAVKIVLAADTDLGEVAEAARLVAGANKWLPVFLQPAFDGSRPTVDAGRLSAAQAVARRSLGDVRISLQMHKVLGVR
jgi:7-carboxy-7-deazaguanine synthase